MTLDLKALNDLLGEIGPTVAKGNDVEVSDDPVTRTVGDDIAQPYGRQFDFLSKGDSLALQHKLNRLSWEEQGYLLEKQIKAGEGKGIPLQSWQASQFGQNPVIAKALDTTGGAALIRQDLEPFLVSIF